MAAELKHLQAAGIKDADKWLELINATCQEFHIDSDKQLAAFLAQTAHESGGYLKLEEDLNYKAKVMATCWPSRFAVMGANGKPQKDANGVNTPNSLALALEHKPTQIANTVYALCMGNGSVESGDGWNYRGRGVLQITGKENYTKCGTKLAIDLVNAPDKLLEPEFAVRSAGWFWDVKNCANFVDRDDFTGLTKRINGQTIGLQDRLNRYQAVLAAMTNAQN